MSVEISKSESIRSCYLLLQDMVLNPKKYSSFDISLLKSQGDFASTDIPAYGIKAMSLNRWKDYADEIVPSGWRELDRLRKKALKVLAKNSQGDTPPSRGTVSDLNNRLKAKKIDYQRCINEIARFGEQYKHLLEICHIHARQSKSFEPLFSNHLKRYSTNNISIHTVDSEKQ
jgi:hypothetical protein